jgi:hypothetical protein
VIYILASHIRCFPINITYNSVVFVGIVIILASVIFPPSQLVSTLSSEEASEKPSAALAVTGRNIYVAWHTNSTLNSNDDVFFRASGDGGKTFGDTVYLSHTASSNSTRIKIDSDRDIVAECQR